MYSLGCPHCMSDPTFTISQKKYRKSRWNRIKSSVKWPHIVFYRVTLKIKDLTTLCLIHSVIFIICTNLQKLCKFEALSILISLKRNLTDTFSHEIFAGIGFLKKTILRFPEFWILKKCKYIFQNPKWSNSSKWT